MQQNNLEVLGGSNITNFGDNLIPYQSNAENENRLKKLRDLIKQFMSTSSRENSEIVRELIHTIDTESILTSESKFGLYNEILYRTVSRSPEYSTLVQKILELVDRVDMPIDSKVEGLIKMLGSTTSENIESGDNVIKKLDPYIDQISNIEILRKNLVMLSIARRTELSHKLYEKVKRVVEANNSTKKLQQ